MRLTGDFKSKTELKHVSHLGMFSFQFCDLATLVIIHKEI
jgi:hypothetical protein